MRVALLVVCSLVVLMALGFSVFGDEPVEFPDHNLEQAIRDAIGKPTGDILVSDLVGLTTLDAHSRSISDLTGIEHSVNLQWLDLHSNQTSDLAPLAGLSALTELDLYINQISDLAPLAGLTALKALLLSANQICDLTPLAGLTALTSLWLQANQISDLVPLAGLTALTDLDLANNQISDLTPLVGLKALTGLYLWGNQITNLVPLAGLTALTSLHLEVNQISNLALLAGLTALEGLNLWGNQISNLVPLAGLSRLRFLDLGANQISNLAPLAGLTALEVLALPYNQISDLAPLLLNSGISSGDFADVRWNFLELTPGSSDMLAIETLVGRGVSIDYEPQNVPPTSHTVGKPTTPSGPSPGQVGVALPFSTGGSTCSQGHSVQYQFDWGDGTSYSSWSSAATASHSYAEVGTYQVKTHARCSHDVAIISSWSYGSVVGISACRPPRFLTLPFSDTDVGLQAGWEYHWATTRSHQGIDYVKKGASGKWVSFSVTAAAGGRAGQGVQPGAAGVWGRYVYIEHDETDCDGNKYFTIYAHLDAVSDRIPGSGTVRVERGEQIGWSGESGTQEGIHLHFEVSTGALPRVGERVDPYDLYSTREVYPPGDNRECGDNRLWTSDPPSLPVADLASQSPAEEMVTILAGTFKMGDGFGEGLLCESPVHTVFVSAFTMDRYEVTKALWDEVATWAADHGYDIGPADGFGKGADHPVNVSWYGAVKWANARSEWEGLTPCYTVGGTVSRTGQSVPDCNWSANGYRLPTEAEWEKAARGGVEGHRFPWNDTDTIQHARANYASSSLYGYDTSRTRGYHPDFDSDPKPYTSPVGSFASNGYGLYDMAGNVWEWCWDYYGESYYSSSPGSDPRGPTSGSYRVGRGGVWSNSALGCRVGSRGSNWPWGASLGFRLVRTAP